VDWARPGTVYRSSLLGRLARGYPRPVVSVTAPAGYGKTTLLSQWARHGSEAFAWVPLDDATNDLKALATHIAEALDAIAPVGERVFDALTAPPGLMPGSAVPRLGAALASLASPVALVLDDVHMLRDSRCHAALSVLADHVPEGSRLVLSGREPAPLRIPRLRAEGRVLEIGPDDLSFSRDEASLLLRAAGATLSADEVAALHHRTEGWPAGVHLAALYLREGGLPPDAAVTFGGDDRLVSEYLESECLARITAQQREFLARTAVLERMCGPLCEAVLRRPGAGPALAKLAQSNLLLVPLDRRGLWYRYHHLFRDMLLAELERQTPELIPVLRRRAAGWCLRNNLPEEALEYSMAAADPGMAARLVESLWTAAYRQGRVATVQRWLRWLEDNGDVRAYPVATVAASLVSATAGRPAEAERWAGMLDRWKGEDRARAFPEAGAAMIRALLCRHGIGQMLADAEEAGSRCASRELICPLVLQGLAHCLSGDLDRADAALRDALSVYRDHGGAPDFLVLALSELALLAMTGGEWPRAEALASQARTVMRQARITESYVAPLAGAVRARVLLHRRDVPAARHELTSAGQPLRLLTYGLPHLAVQARIELARTHLALAGLAEAATLLREVDDLLKRRPGLGTLIGEAAALRAQLARERDRAAPRPSALSPAELRLLPLLSTHLPLPEIATEMALSPHTVRTQGKSIYRKLGVTSRSEAVARARELGLLAGAGTAGMGLRKPGYLRKPG
jgi:LuxR family maltose regulon positive regulatory protein